MLAKIATTIVLVSSILSSTTQAAPARPTRFNTMPLPPPNTWTWVPVPGTMCSDGSVTGFAINTSPGSTDLLINFEEGGVCYDYNTCYVEGKAYNIGHPYNTDTFANENRADALNWSNALTGRFTSDNPFYQANMAWIPYCTGDLHAGNATQTYAPNTTPTYHHGFINGNLMMQAIKAALPNTRRVFISGSSAGGFGAIYQYPNAVNIFGPSLRIDLISDSAVAYSNASWYPSLNIQLPSKSLCPRCDPSNFDTFLPAYASIRPNSRFAALSFQNDSTLPEYENVSPTSLSTEIHTDFTKVSLMNRNVKGFITQGTGHVVFGSPLIPSVINTSLASFMTNMVSASIWTAAV